MSREMYDKEKSDSNNAVTSVISHNGNVMQHKPRSSVALCMLVSFECILYMYHVISCDVAQTWVSVVGGPTVDGSSLENLWGPVAEVWGCTSVESIGADPGTVESVLSASGTE